MNWKAGTNIFSLHVLLDDLKEEEFELLASESFFLTSFEELCWLPLE
jgi:hypothetical protein